MTSILDAALAYAARGWRVFPCIAGTKLPATQTGCKAASIDEAQVRAWFTGTRHNVAIATGGGLYVVDVDTQDFDRNRLPETLISQTPRGGWHYVYTCDEALSNSASKIAKGVDTRGEGGYVVAPPSVVDGRIYTWINEVEPTPLPSWIADALRKPVVVARPQALIITTASGYGGKALQDECDKLRFTAEGSRNVTLNTCAFRVFQLVAGGHVQEAEARAALANAALACGLDERETLKTIESAFRGGVRHPRGPLERMDPLAGAQIYSSTDTIDVPAAQGVKREEDADDRRWELLSEVQSLGGLCESFPTWVSQTARYRQPGITLGALLALGSALGARRFALNGATTAAYVCVVGGTGDGKGHPQACVQRILRDHWSTIVGPSDLSSTVSTIERVSQALENGCGLLFVLDEYGPKLKTLMDPRGYQKEMRALLLDLATRGTGDYVAATSMARGGQDKLLRVPCITLYGSSTPRALHDAIGSMSVDDGFLGRHLFFESQSLLPMRQVPDDDSPPEEVIAAVQAIRSAHETWNKGLPNIGSSADGRPLLLYKPAPVTLTQAAMRVLEDYADACDARRRSRAVGESVPLPLIARAAEHAARVALILAVLAQPGQDALEINEGIARVAMQIVEQSLRTLADSLDRHAAESPHEKARKQVLHAVRDMQTAKDAWVSMREVLKRVPGIKTSEVQDVIKRLHDEGTLEFAKQSTEILVRIGGAA